MTDDPNDWLGVELAGGRYRIIAKLGEGGMGSVYRARDANLDCEVVVKVPHPLMLQQREFAQRFAQEIRSLVQLTHPHIVKISDVGERQGTPFAVMAYLAGGDLDERRPQDDRGNPLPMTAKSLADWLPAVAKALDFVHQRGYVHRDIKPANIIFDDHGNAHVSDFGIVKAFVDSSDAEPGRGMTGTGMVLGTADYMAPEVVMAEEYDGRADQYSLAVTVFELLGARQPFVGATPAAVLVVKVTNRAPAFATIAPHLPKPLCEAVDRALLKDPRKRFASCSEFATAALANFAQTAPSQRTETTVSAALSSGSNLASDMFAPNSPQDVFQIQCPACGRKLKAPRSVVGRRLKCPQCSAMLDLSDAGEVSQFIAVESISSAEKATVKLSSTEPVALARAPAPTTNFVPQQQRSSKSTWPMLLLVGGAISLVLLCVIAPVLIALLLPAVQAAREAANRAACMNNVRNITLAMQMYSDVWGTFPPAYIPDDQGKPMHSWRVLLLPYLEGQALYEQYDFDQPWDSQHNLDLFRDVNLFPCPSGETPLGHTSYMVVTGPGTMFEGSQSASMSSITDGLSNTLMIIEVPHSGVQWSEPVDISAVDLIAKFSDGSIGSESDHAHGVSSGFADGSTHFLRDDISSETLEALTTKSGGEVVQFDDY